MSRHNITGSEAFDRRPFVIVRSVPSGGLRRRRARMALAFVLGIIVALAAVTVALLMVFMPPPMV
ncbi:hypothetical protein [Brevundimonas sp. A19_0]|uniref:hypothetical protein n=1 Tax=Brevundimonas sp. A19_0 TaxID=2821087 RepID=UPI001AD9C92D|nr:hypothetical protein [Brevundimonas sp. A19_0]MBO9500401.1 hypothetical protein [Brevundimonas sp. A19_0]